MQLGRNLVQIESRSFFTIVMISIVHYTWTLVALVSFRECSYS